MKFRNVPLAKKLAIGFGAVLAVVALSSMFTVVQTRQLVEIERLNSISNDVVDSIDQIRGDLMQARADVRKLVLTGEAIDKARTQTSLADLSKNIASTKVILAQDGPEFLPALADFQSKVDAYLLNVITPEIELSSDPATRPQAVAIVSSPASAPYAAAADTAFKTLRDKASSWSDSWTEAGDGAMEKIQIVVVATGVVSILLGLAMAWLIVRAIGRPLTLMIEVMRKVASGDNGVAVPALGQTDEIGQMAGAVQVFKEAAVEKLRLEREAADARAIAENERARNEAARADAAREQAQVVDSVATGLEQLSDGHLTFRLSDPFAPDYEKLRGDFNGAMAKLQETMKTIAANTAAIRSGTVEISTASDDLARRTEQQAASLEETAAALDEITATVKKTSEGSAHARKVVSSAKSEAERSGDVVRKAVVAMSAIEKSAQQVSQIIGVIDEIAFQTNLLALNAGVEAARAGEAGRGFAVVASEVRGLAQRSAEAAKEIKALISASGQQVGEGVELVGETGKALERIVLQVSEINTIVADIASSTHEQAAGLQQVNTAINQMDQVTQQNAAMVEESTAASHGLARESEQLAVLVGRFQVGSESGRSAQVLRRSHAPASRATPTVSAMKTTGRGGAARKPEPAAADENWQEF